MRTPAQRGKEKITKCQNKLEQNLDSRSRGTCPIEWPVGERAWREGWESQNRSPLFFLWTPPGGRAARNTPTLKRSILLGDKRKIGERHKSTSATRQGVRNHIFGAANMLYFNIKRLQDNGPAHYPLVWESGDDRVLGKLRLWEFILQSWLLM